MEDFISRPCLPVVCQRSAGPGLWWPWGWVWAGLAMCTLWPPLGLAQLLACVCYGVSSWAWRRCCLAPGEAQRESSCGQGCGPFLGHQGGFLEEVMLELRGMGRRRGLQGGGSENRGERSPGSPRRPSPPHMLPAATSGRLCSAPKPLFQVCVSPAILGVPWPVVPQSLLPRSQMVSTFRMRTSAVPCGAVLRHSPRPRMPGFQIRPRSWVLGRVDRG